MAIKSGLLKITRFSIVRWLYDAVQQGELVAQLPPTPNGEDVSHTLGHVMRPSIVSVASVEAADGIRKS